MLDQLDQAIGVVACLPQGYDNFSLVDWPYESNRIATDWLNHLQLSEKDKEKICHPNAERVLHP
jgi:hypothetical protein